MAIRFLSEEAEKLYRQRAEDGFSFEDIINIGLVEAAVVKLDHPALPEELPCGYDPAFSEASCSMCERKFKPRWAWIIDPKTGDPRIYDEGIPPRSGNFLVLEHYRTNRFAAHPFCLECIHDARWTTFTSEGKEEKRDKPLYMMAYENAVAEVDRRNSERQEVDERVRYERELRRVRLAALMGLKLLQPKPPAKRRNGGQVLGSIAVEGAGAALKDLKETAKAVL